MSTVLQHDLTFVVDKDEIRLPANRAIMRKASTVFDKMLGLNFAEAGQADVALPEDPAPAFKIVLDIIHLQSRTQSTRATPSAKTIRDLAVLHDKYDVPAVAIYITKWLNEATRFYLGWDPFHLYQFGESLEYTEMVCLTLLAETAFIMREDVAFQGITAALVMKFDQSYFKMTTVMSGYLPVQVPLMLEEKRSKIRACLIDMFSEILGCGAPKCNRTCLYHTRAADLIQGEINDVGTLNAWFGGRSLLSSMEEMLGNVAKSLSLATRGLSCDERDLKDVDRLIDHWRRTSKSCKANAGLCLECARRAGDGDYDGCGVSHEDGLNFVPFWGT